jgi:hypothetical protein
MVGKYGIGRSETRIRATVYIKSAKVIAIFPTSKVRRAVMQRTVFLAVFTMSNFEDMHRVAVNVINVVGFSLSMTIGKAIVVLGEGKDTLNV